MNDGLRTRPSLDLDLLHQRQPEPLGGAAVDLALQRDAVHDPADVLDRGQLDHLDQAELDVHVDDGPVYAQGELDVGVALAGDRVHRQGRAGAGTRAVSSTAASRAIGQRAPPVRQIRRRQRHSGRSSAVAHRPSQAAFTAPPDM